jgi:hypothetical protein
MGKIGHYFHDSLNVTPVASVGTTFDVTKFQLHDLIPDQTFPNSSPSRFPGVTRKTLFANRIEGLHVRVTSIAGGAAKLTCRITADAAGDFTLMPDTEATISTGITTTTSGCVAYAIGIPFFGIVNQDSKFYLWVKTDAGTVTLAQSCITWSE